MDNEHIASYFFVSFVPSVLRKITKTLFLFWGGGGTAHLPLTQCCGVGA